jgi:hypothetical protein
MDIEIATDPNFQARVFAMTATGITQDSIARVIGPSAQAPAISEFMPGMTYYWRVRVNRYSPLLSPWSDVHSFKVEGAVAFTTMTPEVGAADVALQPTFVWTEFPGATSYILALSESADFSILEWSRTTSETFFKPETPLPYSTTYYWRVKGDVEGSPWVTGMFTTMAEPEEPTPPVVIEPTPPTEVEIVQVPVQQPAAIPEYLLWVIVGVGAILVIALIVLIVRTRRVA